MISEDQYIEDYIEGDNFQEQHKFRGEGLSNEETMFRML